MLALLLAGGLWSALVNLGLFAWLLRGRPVAEAMTLTFVALVLIQFFKAYGFRSDRETLWRRPLANRWLNLAIGWELAVLAAVLHVPLLQRALGTVALAPADWGVAVLAAATVVPVLEGVKAAIRRGWIGGAAENV